jgi:hypothetical protein
MVIVKLSGGLGNQMFQYACGRFLSIIKNTELKLDLGYLNDKSHRPGFTVRDYELGAFNFLDNLATEKEVQSFKKPSSFFCKLAFKVKQKIKPRIMVFESKFDLDTLMKASDIYLDGYFQNEKYFKEIKDILLNDFSLKGLLNDRYSEINRQIDACSSVSIHIRRGDYINNAEAHDYHGLCNLDYYEKAISLVSDKVREPHFFVFSDDLDWARKNLKSKYLFTFVDGGENFEDLFLMSQCKHNIIANSSFSWWGSWLNKYPEKVIIAPLKWYNDAKLNSEFKLPEKWVRV